MGPSGYTPWSVVADEQPTAAKWNLLGSNDASFYSGNGINNNAIVHRHIGGSGMIVNQQLFSEGTVASLSALMTYNDSIPTNSQGSQIMTAAYTPKAATNRLLIEADIPVYMNLVNQQNGAVALFQDNVVNAIAAVSEVISLNAGSLGQHFRLTASIIAGTTSPITFKVRGGPQVNGSITVNGGIGGGRFFGGVWTSKLKVTELKP